MRRCEKTPSPTGHLRSACRAQQASFIPDHPSSTTFIMSSNSTTTAIDYDKVFEFHSVPAAAIFTVVYIPLAAWFVRQSIRNTTYVYITLTVFCLMRVAAFAIRAILIARTSLHSDENLFITDQVLFGVGFFALLYSAYTLVLDREIMAGTPAPTLTDTKFAAPDAIPLPRILVRLISDRRLFRIVLIVGVVLAISGITDSTSSDPSKQSSGTNMRRISTILFLVLTGTQALQTGMAFGRQGSASARQWQSTATSFGDQHGMMILALISVLLLVREIFLVVTISDTEAENNEKYWYPLVAVPEVLAVCCYAISGLVPPRKELQRRMAELESGSLESQQQLGMASMGPPGQAPPRWSP
uniref:Uncharacterized protein n=1 Tax=Mycena chlorophos TaxID=658473 RepID=A0ABQ0LM26_MYCCL|nr:predicted protein [Mycena chlorophos]